MRAILFLGIPLTIVGCATPDVPMPRSAAPMAFSLDTGGIAVTGLDQRVDFGRTDHSAILAMSKLVGNKPSSRGDCANGATRVSWPDGIGLIFAGGAFTGWAQAGRQAGLPCT